MKRISILALVATGWVGLMVSATAAEPSEPKREDAEQPEARELAPLEVQGDWLGEANAEDVFAHPGARQVVRRDEIEEAGATTVREVLRRIPGLQAPDNKGTGGANTSLNVGVRGLAARLTPRSTVLLDGVPLSVAPYGQPQLSLAPVSLGNLEAVDVVKSGHAVRYGPQNIGGVINLISRPVPLDEFAGNVQLMGQAWPGGANDGLNRSQANVFLGTPVSDRAGMALLYSGSRGEDFREHSNEQIDDVMLKHRWELAPGHEISGRLHHYEAEAEMPGGLSVAEYDEDRFQSGRPYDRFRGDRQEAVLDYAATLNADTLLDVQTYYTNSFREFTLARENGTAPSRVDVLPRKYEVFAVEPRVTRFYEVGSVGHEVMLGYRYLTEDTWEARDRYAGGGSDPFSVQPTRNRDSSNTTKAHAVYVDDRVVFGEWVVTPGVRFEDVVITRHNNLNGYDESVDYREVLPSLSSLYQLSGRTNLFANYNTSFGSVQHLQLNLQTGPNTLRPEKARSIEFGTRYEYSDSYASAAAFVLHFENQLQYNRTAGHWENRGETLHRGLELTAGHAFAGALEGFGVYATYAYTFATLEEGANEGNELPFYSRHLATLGGEYQRGQWRFGLDGYAQSRQFADEANTVAESADGEIGRIPGYMLWNASARYRLSTSNENNWVALGVKNLFDKEHFTRTTNTNSGKYAGAPRSIYVQANMGF